MITEDKIAAATIAQIFGSELLKAQINARTDSGSSPQFVTVHPRDLLADQQPRAQQYTTMEQQRILQMVQQEAENSCPLPLDSINSQQPIPSAPLPPPLPAQIQQISSQPQQISSAPVVATPTTAPANVWEKIALNLERIANRLETVEITIKKKRIRRK